MLTIGKREASGGAAGDSDHRPQVAVAERGDALACVFSGIWTTRTVAFVDAEMRKIEARKGYNTIVLDLSAIGAGGMCSAHWFISPVNQLMGPRAA